MALELKKVEFTKEDVTVFMGEYLSTPKHCVFFDQPNKPLSPAKFLLAAKQRGIQLALKSRMLYRRNNIFLNGESFGVEGIDQTLLTELADMRRLSGDALASASTDMQETLCLWYEDGWINLQTTNN